ncbi:DUF4230 domain-containing protein [Lactobacillus equicursoris]|uniref:DUF4230 domain-containing protein n=1 Tax=Lactobacillus equicursoris TaxID=420645 RepID=UPI0039930970
MKKNQKFRLPFRGLLTFVAAVVLLMIGGVIGQHLPKASHEKTVTEATISARLAEIGELSTEKYSYTGLYKLTQGEIPLITQKGFSMVYTANFKAGIKVKDVQVKVEHDKVTVTLPAAKILSAAIDPSSIKFYDQKAALFNWSQKEDVTKAEKAALKRAQAAAIKAGILTSAQKSAKKLVKQLLKGQLGNRQLVVLQE